MRSIVHLDLQMPAEYEEQLTCSLVVMPHLSRARWNSFLDDAQIGTVDQTPAIANIAPPIVLGVLDVLDHSELFCCQTIRPSAGWF
jgi:hypothetical protein